MSASTAPILGSICGPRGGEDEELGTRGQKSRWFGIMTNEMRRLFLMICSEYHGVVSDELVRQATSVEIIARRNRCWDGIF